MLPTGSRSSAQSTRTSYPAFFASRYPPICRSLGENKLMADGLRRFFDIRAQHGSPPLRDIRLSRETPGTYDYEDFMAISELAKYAAPVKDMHFGDAVSLGGAGFGSLGDILALYDWSPFSHNRELQLNLQITCWNVKDMATICFPSDDKEKTGTPPVYQGQFLCPEGMNIPLDFCFCFNLEAQDAPERPEGWACEHFPPVEHIANAVLALRCNGFTEIDVLTVRFGDFYMEPWQWSVRKVDNWGEYGDSLEEDEQSSVVIQVMEAARQWDRQVNETMKEKLQNGWRRPAEKSQ